MRYWTTTLRERRTQLGIVCLAVAVAVIGWNRMISTSSSPLPALPPGTAPHSDYALSEFTLTMLDESGELNVLLNGNAMRHDPARERSAFDQPRAHIRQAGHTWHASARSGWISDDGTTIQLDDEVELTREAGSLPELALHSDSLLLYPERERASSPGDVRIMQPSGEVRGRGLRADLAAGEYQLEAQVKGRYEMPQASNEPD